MNRTIKEIATISIIMICLMSSVFFLSYNEYKETFKTEERIKESSDIAILKFKKVVYKSLKRESQKKVDEIASKVRKEIVEEYKDDSQRFIDDYDYTTEESPLLKIIDKHINNQKNRFLYVESDANDMFALTRNGILSDQSEDCSVFGNTRTFENEISMHYNKDLAKEAIETILRGENTDIFGDSEIQTVINKTI